jgi:peptidoglycan hydrolase-like protein with peptidoglycan-binding domain
MSFPYSICIVFLFICPQFDQFRVLGVMIHKILQAVFTLTVVTLAWTLPVSAQSQDDVVWIQIEAQSSLRAGTESARLYADSLEDVNGFALGSGWYGITVGPYTRNDAEAVLRAYRRDRVIPSDSFIVISSALRQQFWPIGANILDRGVLAVPETVVESATDVVQAPEVVVEETPTVEGVIAKPVVPAGETPTEAKRSERALNREAKKDLQRLLQWAGFYNAAIDGYFGRGTRNSMAAWQEANDRAVTGILTTSQRAELLKKYNSILDGLGFEVVRDDAAGIEIMLPTVEVAFEKYESPFAQYKSVGDIGARVLLISQPGDQNTLYGLYDIMQTLEIVPIDGPRERKKNSFVLIGESATMVSETRVSLADGKVKGFTLLWRAGDEERRRRLVGEMDKSLVLLDNVLDPAVRSNDDQAIDLVSALEIRQPAISRSGFYVDDLGTVVTTSDVVDSCTRITLDEVYEADLVSTTADGIAILEPKSALAPLDVAAFSAQTPRLNSEIAVAGYSYEGVLNSPSMTYGTLSDLRGLRGEEQLNRLALSALPGDAGGPVLDSTGGVLGMLLPTAKDSAGLPSDVSFSLNRDTVQAALNAAGKTGRTSGSNAPMAAQDISETARGMTVLVSCWK